MSDHPERDQDRKKEIEEVFVDQPNPNPGNPNVKRPPVPRVALPHEHDEEIPFAETRGMGPVPGAIYGLMAEYEDASVLAAATRQAREAGYRKLEAYTPFPVHEVIDAIGIKRTWVPTLVLIGGLVGLVGGYLLQYWTQVIDYPLNVGGRPLHSWPLFIPVTFETTILLAAFAAVFGMLAMNGLPMPYHPVFNVPRFALASRDRFFLVIEAEDDKFDYAEVRDFMATSGAREVFDVPH
jgi:hypothetical protein